MAGRMQGSRMGARRIGKNGGRRTWRHEGQKNRPPRRLQSTMHHAVQPCTEAAGGLSTARSEKRLPHARRTVSWGHPAVGCI